MIGREKTTRKMFEIQLKNQLQMQPDVYRKLLKQPEQLWKEVSYAFV